ncbi:MAG: hypothetical protein A2Y33_07025 [Spirochaetes bacterium GWF1_51_8]|nr:MAG: hypothetical protein A2Y33_07025 [Spirochaetes bacterium GWF1_51_8]
MRKLFPILFIILSAAALFADEPSIEVMIDQQTIAMNEEAQIIIKMDRKAEDITTPAANMFRLEGPYVSQSMNMMYANGQMSQTVEYEYKFILFPKTKGKFKIGAFTIKTGGKSYKTQPLEIKITAPSKQAGTTQNDPFSIMEKIFNHNQQKTPEIFLKLIPAKSGVFQGTPVIVDAVAFCTDPEILNSQFVETSTIRGDKYLIYDLTAFVSNNVSAPVTISGELYYPKIVKRYVLFPIETGSLVVVPPQIVAISPYGHLLLAADNIGIDSFKYSDKTGLSYIGTLSAKSALETNLADAGKRVTFTLEMEGNGNLKVLSNPLKNLSIPGLFIAQPQTSIGFKEWKGNSPIFVQKIVYSILALKPGKYEIPSILIDYFDTDMNPRQIELPGGTIDAAASKGVSAAKTVYTPKPLDGIADRSGNPLPPFVWIVFGLFGMSPFASFLYGRHKDKMSGDAGYSRRFLANKRLSKYLNDSRANLKQGNFKEFYLSLSKGLFYYITDKTGLPAGMAFRDILAELGKRGTPPQTLDELQKIYDTCNRNAFSGAADEKAVDETLEMAVRLFSKF